jgi:hypothetical protein
MSPSSCCPLSPSCNNSGLQVRSKTPLQCQLPEHGRGWECTLQFALTVDASSLGEFREPGVLASWQGTNIEFQGMSVLQTLRLGFVLRLLRTCQIFSLGISFHQIPHSLLTRNKQQIELAIELPQLKIWCFLSFKCLFNSISVDPQQLPSGAPRRASHKYTLMHMKHV